VRVVLVERVPAPELEAGDERAAGRDVRAQPATIARACPAA
jgi:hypothetical protein